MNLADARKGLTGSQQTQAIVLGRRNLEQFVEMRDPEQRSDMVIQVGQDKATSALFGLLQCLYQRGHA